MTVGDETTIVAKRKGNISILAYNGHEWIRKIMTNVLYVPEIHANLVSSGKIMDRGPQQRSDNKRCKFLKDGHVVAVGARKEKLFLMMFKVNEHE